jgi:hypothetical protein
MQVFIFILALPTKGLLGEVDENLINRSFCYTISK